MRFTSARASLALFLVAIGLATVFSASAAAHDGHPIVLEAKYTEIHHGVRVRRMIFVTGHAHYPDGTILKVAVRPAGSKQYVDDWISARVRKEAFAADMGPYMKEFSSGEYIIEAWFRFDDQPESVRDAILKSQEGADGGVGICTAERVAAQLGCISKKVFGVAVVAVGTPARAMLEEQAALEFFGQVRESLQAILDEARDGYRRHSAGDKDPALNVSVWQARAEEWRARVSQIDVALLRWNNSKLNAPHRPAYAAANTAMVNLEGLIGAHGRELYDLASGFPGGSPASLDAQVVESLRQITEELGIPVEEKVK